MSNKKVWYVTGASKGLGLALVKKLLTEGHHVAATSRTITALIEAVGSSKSEDFLPLEVDLSDEQSINDSMKATHNAFGRIDVVVNNAGYGIGGAVEELSQQEITDSFGVNLFATINVIQKAMPYLRAQQSGHIINISSIAGFAGGLGWAMYSASKHAVIGLSEGLAQEVKQFGVKVTVVAPGAFRTQFLSSESLVISENNIADYTDVHESHQKYYAMDGKQIGDPDKAAYALMAIVASPNPPTLLFIGSDAYNRAQAKINQIKEQMEAWKSTTLSTQIEE